MPALPQVQPQYARFSRRLKAVFIDWTIYLASVFGAVTIASLVRDDALSRALAVSVIVALLLYEPLLVSGLGGTIGHCMTNLRVVDDAHGGNVSLPKSFARFFVKAVLGWYSFIAMGVTRRHQTVHDLLTRSTVQPRNPKDAVLGHFVAERTDLETPDLPSRGRRIGIIALYCVLAFAAYLVATELLIDAGVLSLRCVDRDFCDGPEKGILMTAAAMTIAAFAAAIVFGWKGRLFGARRGGRQKP